MYSDDASGTSFFKFKEEQLFDTKHTIQDSAQASILQVNFDAFEEVVQKIDTRKRLGLSEHDSNLVSGFLWLPPFGLIARKIGYALENIPAQLEKPIVPSFATNVRGLVMFNAPMVVKPNKIDGIFGRNNPVIPMANKKNTAEGLSDRRQRPGILLIWFDR